MLHDTFGFPIDLTVEIAQGAGHDVDIEGFDRAMERQREARPRQRQGRRLGHVQRRLDGALRHPACDRVLRVRGRCLEGARVLAIVRDGERVERAAAGDEVEVVLDRTPFYAEMGGQVGDTGVLAGGRHARGGLRHQVYTYIYYVVTVEEGELFEGGFVTATVDHYRRELLRRNHTATHLLDAALKEVLGDHVNQAGSLVTPDHLRFDFTHFEALSAEQLARVEDLVNAQIFAAKPVVTAVMGHR